VRTAEEKDAICKRIMGTPFKPLPGSPPQHKVVGHTTDGTKIRVYAVEMVMNDAWLMVTVEGQSYYASFHPFDGNAAAIRQREIYDLAVRLYGCQPADLHGGREGPYKLD
jgi:hypothetical protein